MVIVTILAWATQTLFHQWGYGAVIVPAATTPTIEIRERALISSPVVHLKDIARWSSADAAVLAPYAETVIGDLQSPQLIRQISVRQIAGALHDAGISLATVRLAGSSDCEVTRSATASWTPVAVARPVQAAALSRIPATLAPVKLANEPAATTRPVVAIAEPVKAAPATGPTIAKASVAATQPAVAAAGMPATQPSFTVRPGDPITATFDIYGTQLQTVLSAIDPAKGPETIRAKNDATGEEYFVKLTSATEGKVLPYVASTE